jgi:hypothetical protein
MRAQPPCPRLHGALVLQPWRHFCRVQMHFYACRQCSISLGDTYEGSYGTMPWSMHADMHTCTMRAGSQRTAVQSAAAGTPSKHRAANTKEVKSSKGGKGPVSIEAAAAHILTAGAGWLMVQVRPLLCSMSWLSFQLWLSRPALPTIKGSSPAIGIGLCMMHHKASEVVMRGAVCCSSRWPERSGASSGGWLRHAVGAPSSRSSTCKPLPLQTAGSTQCSQGCSLPPPPPPRLCAGVLLATSQPTRAPCDTPSSAMA